MFSLKEWALLNLKDSWRLSADVVVKVRLKDLEAWDLRLTALFGLLAIWSHKGWRFHLLLRMRRYRKIVCNSDPKFLLARITFDFWVHLLLVVVRSFHYDLRLSLPSGILNLPVSCFNFSDPCLHVTCWQLSLSVSLKQVFDVFLFHYIVVGTHPVIVKPDMSD